VFVTFLPDTQDLGELVPGTQQFNALPAKEEAILQASLQANTQMEVKHGW
jgi:hypothetical protein